MFDKYRKTLVAGTVALALGLSATGVMAAGLNQRHQPGNSVLSSLIPTVMHL